MEYITNILIPLILLAGMIYVVGHQYREQEARLKTRQDEKKEYLEDKAKAKI